MRLWAKGIHLINPLKTNNELSIQTQTLKESASVPSSEGLMMSLDTSLIYHLNPDRAAEVFQNIGADYENVVVEPTLRSAIRESTASHSANALYTGEREMVGKQILDQITQALNQTRHHRGECSAARYSTAGDAESLDRGQAAGRAGSPGDELPPAERRRRRRSASASRPLACATSSKS